MIVGRRRSQELLTKAVNQRKERERRELMKKQVITTLDENYVQQGSGIHRISRKRDQRDSMLEMLGSNIRPSSLAESKQSLRQSRETYFNRGSQCSPSIKLEKRVHELIEQRVRLVSRLQQESLLADNITESTEPIMVSCLSKTSVESDVDKQVNFVIVPQSECTPWPYLELIVCRNKQKGRQCQVKAEQGGHTAIDIALAYLLERPSQLRRIFTGLDSEECYRINIKLRGRIKTLQVAHSQAHGAKDVGFYRQLMCLATELLPSSHNLTDVFEMFAPVYGFVADINQHTTAQLAARKDCRMYVCDEYGQYIPIDKVTQNHAEIFYNGKIQTLQLDYLRFLYGKVHVIQGYDCQLQQQHLRLCHHPNHFNVATLSIARQDMVRILTVPQEQTHLVLTDTRTKQIIGFLSPNQRCLRVPLQKGEYELYVSSKNSATKLTFLSNSSLKTSLKHKESYRNYTEQLVTSYLQGKLNAICRCTSQPRIVRCELFIGFAAEVICNPSSKPLSITLKYSEGVLCDLNYRKTSISLEVMPFEHLIVPLRRLAPFSSSPELPCHNKRL